MDDTDFYTKLIHRREKTVIKLFLFHDIGQSQYDIVQIIFVLSIWFIILIYSLSGV